jgi:signal transduction histidine kinase
MSHEATARAPIPAEIWLDHILSHEDLIAWAVDPDLLLLAVRGPRVGLQGELPEQELTGHPLALITPAEDRGEMLEAHKAALGGEAVRRQYKWGPNYYDSLLRPWYEGGQLKGVLGVAVDRTEMVVQQRELEANLRAISQIDKERRDLLARLVQAHADERQRITQELHNHLGQDLTGAILAMTALKRDLADTAYADRIEMVLKLSEKMLSAVRSLSGSFSEFQIRDMGLASALRRMAEAVSENTDIRVTIETDGSSDPENVNVDLATRVFRVVQEAVTNAVRHSGCSHVDIDVSSDGQGLLVVIEDDGTGIDLDASNSGSGLRMMRAQVTAVGGFLDVARRGSSGTRIRMQVPVKSS